MDKISDEDLIEEILRRDITEKVLDRVSDSNLKFEVENRLMHYQFTKDIGEFDTDDLISELENREYVVKAKGENTEVFELYRDWLTLSKDSFEKELKKFFLKTLDIYVK